MMPEMFPSAESDTQILHPGSRKLFAHWEMLRAERPYPTREEFSFTPIKELMPDMILIEKDHLRSSYRFRLAGSRVCSLFGRNLTAADALQGWDAFEASVLTSHFELALRDFQPVLVRMRLMTDTGIAIAAELVALPIQIRESNRVQLIGGLFPFRDIQTIGHSAIRARELVSARTIWTEHQGGSRRTAAPLPGTRGLPPLNAPAPRLRVVQGGRSTA
jgi:hypothetical protein